MLFFRPLHSWGCEKNHTNLSFRIFVMFTVEFPWFIQNNFSGLQVAHKSYAALLSSGSPKDLADIHVHSAAMEA